MGMGGPYDFANHRKVSRKFRGDAMLVCLLFATKPGAPEKNPSVDRCAFPQTARRMNIGRLEKKAQKYSS
jgi:hypothetical protein